MMTAERVSWYLWNWEHWIGVSRTPGRLPNHACVGENYRSYDYNSDSAYEEMCRVAGAAVQAVLDGIAPRLRIAVYITHEIARFDAFSNVYRIRGDVDTAYENATTVVGVKLHARGMT